MCVVARGREERCSWEAGGRVGRKCSGPGHANCALQDDADISLPCPGRLHPNTGPGLAPPQPSKLQKDVATFLRAELGVKCKEEVDLPRLVTIL
jgi:hypothetical protein